MKITFLLLFIEYENACENRELNLPDLICVITGKGPLKDFYMAIVNLKNWKHVKVKTLWLENEDYPKILGITHLYVITIINKFFFSITYIIYSLIFFYKRFFIFLYFK